MQSLSIVLMKETLDEAEPSLRGAQVLVPRLVRVLRYEDLAAGGGPVIELGRGALTLGRGETEGMRDDAEGRSFDAADAMMSRMHARVAAAGVGQYVLEDLGSRNGTLVDGKAVTSHHLTDGTVFETGRTAWIFRLAPRGSPEHVRLGPTRSFSPRVVGLIEQLASLAPRAVSLLLLGETGTGKEVFARELHGRSGRRGRFVAVNCGALADTLVESELFGHVKGSFTGATTDRVGHVESADRGTLFLDEVGEMPPSAQVRLLRVLQEGEVVPVGATAPRRVDVRVVAATHRDLLRMVDEGRFREDLYARLEGWVFRLPRLAERREDLGELVAHALRSAGAGHAALTPRAARALLAFDWPFNVRQLMKSIEAALALAQSGRIELEHLPERVRAGASRPSGPPVQAQSSSSSVAPPEDLDPDDRELRDRIVAALRANGGNVTRAAEALGKQRQQMQRWMRRFQLRATDFGGED
ncbi:MAG TPA: sigma 54-interacting transcriptional regulator [Polyangiaceae bacterium]|nr:sigma 54-interacting transcriptional regulator [Polyangiaceae bacterium]